MEKYFKSTIAVFASPFYILSKPASLLCFVDPSLSTRNRVKCLYRYRRDVQTVEVRANQTDLEYSEFLQNL